MKKLIIDCEMGIETLVEMTPEEEAEHLAAAQAAAEEDARRLADSEIVRQQKRASLKKLAKAAGVTEVEMAELLGG